MVAPDKFFEVLLVDGAIMYNVYNPSTGILDITYRETSYLCDLSGLTASFPERRRYTLQTAGLYLFACQMHDLDTNLTYDTVTGNYLLIKQKNSSSKSDLLALILISVPSFLLPVISNTQPTSIKINGSFNYPQNVTPSSTSDSDGRITSILLTFLVFVIIVLLIFLTRAGKK